MYEKKKRPSSKEVEAVLKRLPSRSEEEEVKYAGNLAMGLAIDWMEKGTAPAQIVTHFLKVNSPKEQAEIEKIHHDIELLKAKKKAIELAEEQDKKYEEVIRAISAYAGKDQEWETVEDDYPEY